MPYSTERVNQIWNDDHGERIEVGPDSDSLDLCEVRSVSDDGVIGARIVMQPEQAVLVAKAILELYDKP